MSPSLSLHTVKRLWQRHVLAENRRSIEGLLETLCDEPVYTVVATGERHIGRQAVAAFYRGLFEAMPDVTFELQSVFVAEEGVVEESTLKGTHTGPLFGVAATGRAVALPLVIVFPLEAGRFLGERMYFDLGTLHRQLGLAS